MRKLPSQEEIMLTWGKGNSNPVVSICCITYNHESYIEDALEGFLIQKTDFPFEILIHDDASSDGTAEIIRDYEAKYPEMIKAIYQTTNQYSLNKRINQDFNFPRAEGKYIALCEGDDFWVDEHKLKIQKEFLDLNKEYVICYGDVKAIDENGNAGDDFGGARKDLSSTELQKAPSIFTLTTMFRNLISSTPLELTNARYGDLTMWSRIGEYGKGKYLSEIKPSIYRLHQGGIHSQQSQDKQFQMRLETMMALYSYWLKHSNYQLANYFLEEVAISMIRLRRIELFKSLLFRFNKALLRKLSRYLEQGLHRLKAMWTE